MKNYRLPYEYEEMMEHSKWVKGIPYIQFPSDWKVQITPPFAGAVVRFRVQKDDREVSIYLDCYNRLGYYGSPYWEVYPYEEDVFRCDMSDTESLLNAITHSLSEQSACTCRNSELEKGSLVPVFCHTCNAYVQTDL